MRARHISTRAIIALGVAAVACGESSDGRLFGKGHADSGAHPSVGSGGANDVSHPPGVGCVKDTDCKGDRVCANGMCVDPSGGGAGGSPTDPPDSSGGANLSTGGRGADGGSDAGGSDASGGRRATGGGGATTMTGGTSSGGADSGGTGNGGAGTGGKPAMCSVGQKPCQGKCVYPTPAVGCDLVSCTACAGAVPAHGYATCANSQCSYECAAGYVKVSGFCIATGGTGGFTGGAGGRMGTGGFTESCNAPSDCHNACTITGPTRF
jgi:hypothetical protein